MTTLVIQTPLEPTDTGLPIDYRDAQLNAGTRLAIDFRYKFCSPGQDGLIAHNTQFNNMLDDGVDPAVWLGGAAGSATFSSVSSQMNMATTDEFVSSYIDGRSGFSIGGAKSFGAVIWFKIGVLNPFLGGFGKSIAGFPISGAVAANRTPGLVVLEKRRRTITAVDTAADQMTLAGHGLSNGARVEFGGTLPGGLSSSVLYYVVDASVDAFKVSTTIGGVSVDITSSGGSFYVMDNVFRPKMYSAIGGDSPSSRSLTDTVWDISEDEIVQLAFGWSVKDGVGRAAVMINGASGKMESTSASVTTLPTSGFENFKLGVGLLPYQNTNQPGDITIYRAILEDMTVSGRTLEEMAAADYAAHAAGILARG